MKITENHNNIVVVVQTPRNFAAKPADLWSKLSSKYGGWYLPKIEKLDIKTQKALICWSIVFLESTWFKSFSSAILFDY